MRLSARDLAIIADLERFRCLSRDDICDIHFCDVKHQVKAANSTLLRLYRQGLIDRSDVYNPFVYLPAGSTMKKNSQKIPHFLEIVRVYRDLLAYEKPSTFLVEPKYSEKGGVEPDIFAIFKRSPLFIEVQRSIYSEKVMAEKIARYEKLYASGLLKSESWQPAGRTVFPSLLILSPTTRYAVSSSNFPIMQAASVDDFMRIYTPVVPADPPSKMKSRPLTINLK
ncbi:hypothetical protein [Bacillus sp. 37MA]|uniref:hypothetical protein n=1 Tax=Bacillus sp. 37MA TaxID=1132442 RepID=UPI0003760487|nr:hypothetical protein [Bacillus sp. 37MA]